MFLALLDMFVVSSVHSVNKVRC